MSVIQIVAGALLLLACIFIVLVVLVQEPKDPGMTSAISGGSNDSFYNKNTGRTREAQLNRLAKVSAILFFVVTLAVNVFAAYTI